MVAKKKISILTAVLLTMSIFGGCGKPQDTKEKSLSDKETIKIGITQIIEHPALDKSREGFIDALKSKGFEDGKNIKIDYQNAQGDMPTTQSIAKDFVSKKEDIIFAVATPSAQAAFNATKEIPILITAVTDPVDAGLVKSIEKPGTNVTGTSDIVPIEDQLQLLKKIMPKAKKVGILFNTSENNSQIQVKNIKNAASKFELEVMESSITNVNEVPQALNSLLEKVDVLYTPTDNTVASAMTMISNECFKKSVPIIGAERAHVTGGALATIGIDYYKLGFQTGLLAVDIINGKKPSEMPIETLEQMQLVINEDSVKKLNLNIPKELIEKAEMVKKGDK